MPKKLPHRIKGKLAGIRSAAILVYSVNSTFEAIADCNILMVDVCFSIIFHLLHTEQKARKCRNQEKKF